MRTGAQRAPRNLVDDAIGRRTGRSAEVDSTVVIDAPRNDFVDVHEQYRHGPKCRGTRGLRDVGRRTPLSGPAGSWNTSPEMLPEMSSMTLVMMYWVSLLI